MNSSHRSCIPFVLGLSVLFFCMGISDNDTDSYRQVHGCFSPGTRIVMGDGLEKKIENVEVGNFVWNPLIKKAVRVQKVISGPEPNSLVRIEYDGQRLEVSQSHPMVVSGQEEKVSRVEDVAGARRITVTEKVETKKAKPLAYRVKLAKDLKQGEKLLGRDGKFYEVTLAKELSVLEGQVVHSLSIEAEGDSLEEHAVVAQGVVTGDYVIEEKLNKK